MSQYQESMRNAEGYCQTCRAPLDIAGRCASCASERVIVGKTNVVAEVSKALMIYIGIQRCYVTADKQLAFLYTSFGFFTLAYNGGEINVRKQNDWAYPRSIPTDWFGVPLNTHTMAYRVLCALKDEEIDYEHRENDIPLELFGKDLTRHSSGVTEEKRDE